MYAVSSFASASSPFHHYNSNNHNAWLMQQQYLAQQQQQQAQQQQQQQFFHRQRQHIIPFPYSSSNLSNMNNDTNDPPNKLKHKDVVLYKTESCRNWTELGHCRYKKEKKEDFQ